MTTCVPGSAAENSRAKNLNAIRSMRADAAKVKPKPANPRRPDTPAVVADRENSKRWYAQNKSKVSEYHITYAQNRRAAAKQRMLDAIAQADRTQRNLDDLTQGEPK